MKQNDSFGSWLIQQKYRDNPIGDLASDFIDDAKLNGYEPCSIILPSNFYSLISAKGGHVFNAANEAAKEYMQHKWMQKYKNKYAFANNDRSANNRFTSFYKTWGVWYLNPYNLSLIHIHNQYEIDLEMINNSAEMLDWIFQISHKGTGYGKNAVKDLIDAFDEIFKPQENCCSNGIGKIFNGSSLTKNYVVKYHATKQKSF